MACRESSSNLPVTCPLTVNRYQLVNPQCKIVNNIGPFYKTSNRLMCWSDHLQQHLLGQHTKKMVIQPFNRNICLKPHYQLNSIPCPYVHL